MKKYAVAIALVLCCVARAAEAPVMPEPAKVKILKAQLAQEQLKSEYNQLMSRKAEIEKQYPATEMELQVAMEEAYKLAKVDKKEFSIDIKKLEFVAVQKPKTEKP